MNLDYRIIFRELNHSAIDYLVVGGMAVNFHGIPRMTYDIDIMISLDDENILKLVDRLIQWGFKVKVPVDPRDLANKAKRDEWIDEKGMKAMNFYNETSPIGEIDILFDSPVPYDDLKARAVFVVIDNEKIPTISIHDLIEMKMKAGRKQDLSDVEHLKIILES